MAWKTHEQSDYVALQECVGEGFYAVVYATPSDDEKQMNIYLGENFDSADHCYERIKESLEAARELWGLDEYPVTLKKT